MQKNMRKVWQTAVNSVSKIRRSKLPPHCQSSSFIIIIIIINIISSSSVKHPVFLGRMDGSSNIMSFGASFILDAFHNTISYW